MSIRMIVTDLDGTIVNSDKEGYEISSQLVEEVNGLKKKGKIFTIATGRSEEASKEIIQVLGIDTPFIIYNGAKIVDGQGKEIYSDTFQLITWIPFLEKLQQIGATIIFSYSGQLYCYKHTKRIPIYEKKEQIQCMVFDSKLAHEKILVNKILIIGSVEKYKEYWDELEENIKHKYRYVISEDDYFEIVNRNISKGNALKVLKQYLDIKDEEVVTIGNHMNDKELIEEGHIGVAVGNAIEELKDIADYVTEGEYEDGVIEVIKKFT